MAQPVWLTPAGSLGTIPEEVFYSLPVLAVEPVVTLSAAIATSFDSKVTFQFTPQSSIPYEIGSTIVTSGFTPSGLNGTYIVTGASIQSVSFVNSTLINRSTITSVESTGSVVTFNFAQTISTMPYPVGSTIVVSGFIPSGYNGTYTVTGATATSVTFANSTTSAVTKYGIVTNFISGNIVNVPGQVQYVLLAGKLPDGIQVQQSGLLSGVPTATVNVQGVPFQVSRDVTSKFTIRASVTKVFNSVPTTRVVDRTFTITVTGQNPPQFVTPSGILGEFFSGTLVNYQVLYEDPDPADVVVVSLIAGSLPPDLTISSSGLISGLVNYNDVGTEIPYTDYNFILELSDGKSSDLRSYSIKIWARSSMTADNTYLTADNTFITADTNADAALPVILNPQGSIGVVRSDNYFAYQFDGVDPNGDPIEYISSSLPPGLTLDINSGWLYGYIPDLGITENTFNFTVRVRQANDPTVISPPYAYTLYVNGSINSDITWLTPSDLGTIFNGATSTFYVEAVSVAGLDLYYRLLSGSDSNLPQGLKLLTSGHIVGKVSFNTFALDGGTTTFDVTPVSGVVKPTTFDMKHTFTVNVYSLDGVISANKTFSITVIREFNEPYDNLYVQAMPPLVDRAVIAAFLEDEDVFQPDLIYRNDDPNFGVATDVIYNHAFGLTAATLEDYYSSLYENHYWKELVLGDIKVAQARDSLGNIIYEVVYSQIIDNLVNNNGVSVGKQVPLAFPLNVNEIDQIDVVFPNSLTDMRIQVIDTVGQISNALPSWMISKQANGQILGFTPAWVIAYAKPGFGDQLAYYVRNAVGQSLNLIDFTVDRYELDRSLSHNWNPVTQEWNPYPPQLTTFDVDAHFEVTAVNDPGLGYNVNDRIKILGSQLDGVNVTNDVYITVTSVNSSTGAILSARSAGNAPILSPGESFTDVSGTTLTGSGTGATWNILAVGEDPTVFDGNSLQFTDPVDMYDPTDQYNKYLVFPKRTIIEPIY